MAVTLSKSKYLNGLQCKKLLWYVYNNKEDVPAPDEAAQAIFEQGQLVGEYAKKLFSKGLEIDHTKNFQVGLSLTKELLAKRVSLFEAAVSYKNCYARADILEPVGKDKWNIIEVKSSTSLKDINLSDVGFQYYVFSGAGLKINKCYLMCIDSSYVRQGAIDLKKLFKKIDVTNEVKILHGKMVEKNVQEMVAVISSKTFPQIDIGSHCSDPYDCPLKDKCWSFLPDRNVLMLYRNKKLPLALIKSDILKLVDIPERFKLNEKQKIQIACEKTGNPYIDKKKIDKFLSSIQYPAYYVDFETWTSVIPMFDGSRPYQQIPFQFSLHVVRNYGEQSEHYSFLADGVNDQRSEFMKKLKEVMGAKGSVIAYNAGFEISRLKECAEVLPEYRKWVSSIEDRVVDLLRPFRDFAYYHPLQNGSCSIKKVLPVLTGRSYSEMEIGDGGTASREYFRVTFTDDNKDKTEVRKNLLEYCGLDTLAMVEIVEKISKFL